MTWQQLVSKQDLSASFVVLLVALPLCMGVAIASGMPPSAGLITGIVGGLLVGAIGGSPLQVSGPAAGLTVLVWTIVEDFGLAAVGGIVMLAGIFQAVAGLFGAGRVFRAISPAVVYGMLGGIGVLILVAQLHVMIDDKPLKSGLANLLAVPVAVKKSLVVDPSRSHRAAALIGVLTIALIVVWNRWKPAAMRWLPAPLLAILAVTACCALGNIQVQFVTIPEQLLGAIQLPNSESLSDLWGHSQLKAAISLAVIASAETLLCAGAVDRMQENVRADYDSELLAQGIGNSVCGLLGALPMTGVIVRSAANVEAGARTRASTMLHGLWILTVVVLFPYGLRMVPTASLAGVLVYTGFKLVNPTQIRELREYGWQSTAIYAATLVGVVVTDLLTGVVIGVALSWLQLLLRLGSFSLVLKLGEKHVEARLSGAVTFVGLPRLSAELDAMPTGEDVYLDVSSVTFIDHACLQALSDFERQRRLRGIRVHLDWNVLESRSEKAAQKALLASSSQ